MLGVFDLIFGKKKDPIQTGAWKAIESLQETIKVLSEDGIFRHIKLQNESLVRIIPNDPKSPTLINIDENKKLIYYPEYSTPYSSKLINKCKEIKVIDGKIFDECSDKVYSVGDVLLITPETKIRPFTLDSKAIVEVNFKDCKK